MIKNRTIFINIGDSFADLDFMKINFLKNETFNYDSCNLLT